VCDGRFDFSKKFQKFSQARNCKERSISKEKKQILNTVEAMLRKKKKEKKL
jgi:hypothetical protein